MLFGSVSPPIETLQLKCTKGCGTNICPKAELRQTSVQIAISLSTNFNKLLIKGTLILSFEAVRNV